MKICKKCKETKSLENFSPNKTTKDRVSIYCRSCDCKRAKNRQRLLFSRETIESPPTKYCPDCKLTKPSVSFHRDKCVLDGLGVRCKNCTKIKDKFRYQNNHEKDSVMAKLRIMLQSAKKRALKGNLPFEIDIKFLVEKFYNLKKCPVLGTDIDWQSKNQLHHNSPSLDKIIPIYGYTKDNTQLISCKANTMKQNASPEELLKFSNYYINMFKGHRTNG